MMAAWICGSATHLAIAVKVHRTARSENGSMRYAAVVDCPYRPSIRERTGAVSRHPRPRKVTVDGAESVVLTIDEYERLAGLRRQVGAQGTRIRILTQKLNDAQALLSDIERAIAESPECGHEDAADLDDHECPECRLLVRIRSLAVSGLPAAG